MAFYAPSPTADDAVLVAAFRARAPLGLSASRHALDDDGAQLELVVDARGDRLHLSAVLGGSGGPDAGSVTRKRSRPDYGSRSALSSSAASAAPLDSLVYQASIDDAWLREFQTRQALGGDPALVAEALLGALLPPGSGAAQVQPDAVAAATAGGGARGSLASVGGGSAGSHDSGGGGGTWAEAAHEQELPSSSTAGPTFHLVAGPSYAPRAQQKLDVRVAVTPTVAAEIRLQLVPSSTDRQLVQLVAAQARALVALEAAQLAHARVAAAAAAPAAAAASGRPASPGRRGLGGSAAAASAGAPPAAAAKPRALVVPAAVAVGGAGSGHKRRGLHLGGGGT